MHRDVCTLSVHQLKLWTSLQRVGLFRVVLKLWIICFAEFCRNKFLQKKLCFFPLQIFKCFVQSSVWPKVSRKAITSCLWRGQLKWPGKERKRWRRKCNYVISSPPFFKSHKKSILTQNSKWIGVSLESKISFENCPNHIYENCFQNVKFLLDMAYMSRR